MHQQDHILVVESDDLIRQLLEQWLSEAGYAVTATASCDLPLEREPVLVVANVSRPFSGTDPIRSLRARHAAPILALSARFRRGLGSSAEAARRLRVRKVLPKPFTRDELLAAVSESIAGP